MKSPFPDPLKSGPGSHVPSVVETEEVKRRASLQSVVDLPGITLSLLARGGWEGMGADFPTVLCPHMLPIFSSMYSFPCLILSPSCLFWVPGFVEMLCSHSNYIALSHCFSLSLRWPGVES